MALPFPSHFLFQVPLCSPSDPLRAVAEALGGGAHSYGIVLTPDHQPLGIIRASRLLGYLLATSEAFTGVSTVAARPTGADLEVVCLSHHLEWIEPVRLIWAEQPLEQELAETAGSVNLPWAVVGRQRTYLGMLDWSRLLPLLASDHSLPGPQAVPPPNFQADLQGPSQAAPKIPASPALRHSLRSQTPLYTLLEQIPLPLMLQAVEGETLFCNQIWTEQVFIDLGVAHWQPLKSAAESSIWPLQPLLTLAKSGHLGDRAEIGQVPQIADIAAPANSDSSPETLAWQLIRMPLSSGFRESSSTTLPVSLWIDTLLQTAAIEGKPGSQATLLTQPDAPDLWLVLALPVRAGPLPQLPQPPPQPPSPSQQSPPELLPPKPKTTWLLELNHELKSPLTSLLGLSTLLQDPRLGPLNPRQDRYVRLLNQTTRRLVSTVNQLLDWFRLDCGQLVLFPTAISLQELGPQIIRSIQTPAAAAGLAVTGEEHFTWSVEPGLTTLVADPLRLRQMLQHLANHTLSYIGDQTDWGLQVERWGSWFALTIWDRGDGLPAAVQEQLFRDRYEPVEASSPPAGRTDLGLILTWHLAHLHGGDLTFMSSPGQGSHFTLLLPSAEQEQPSSPASELSPTASQAAPTTELLLLACTEVTVIEAVTHPLQETAYRLAIARSYPELLDKAHRLNPALVLIHPESFPAQVWEAVPQIGPIPPVFLSSSAASAGSSFGGSRHLSLQQLPDQLLPHLQALLSSAPVAPAWPPPPRLTILHLSEATPTKSTHPPWSLSGWLYDFPCRVLEVDDLVQAEVLCRVWKPHVVLLDPSITEADLYLARLAQLPSLRNRPLVTLTPDLTRAAGQWSQMSVFPCHEALTLGPERAAALLMESISAAAAAQ
ncbi:MAG: HAMP domain-containing histidine kinase [Cyanobacteria bacterium Co-bin13]|nr:HAMP domain-containing histidine kinase [Cyanobacteria bacterium Co-bin13]